MINFEEELKKFHPSLEVEDAEEAIYNQDLTDMADLLVKMIPRISRIYFSSKKLNLNAKTARTSRKSEILSAFFTSSSDI